MQHQSKTFPRGAIRNINQLLKYRNKTIYFASRRHSSKPEAEYFNGVIGTREFSPLYVGDDFIYHYFETKVNYSNSYQRHSFKDANIIRNNYNDWFVFTNIRDARRYLGQCPYCGFPKSDNL
jgi:hypothetical protein